MRYSRIHDWAIDEFCDKVQKLQVNTSRYRAWVSLLLFCDNKTVQEATGGLKITSIVVIRDELIVRRKNTMKTSFPVNEQHRIQIRA